MKRMVLVLSAMFLAVVAMRSSVRCSSSVQATELSALPPDPFATTPQ